MRQLVEGVIDFHKRVRPRVKDSYARLAQGQAPDALFIACSDSRVAANVFASTDPGELFVVRTIGNLVAPCDAEGQSVSDESEAAAIEYALLRLPVRHIVVCGHSECGAMQALFADTQDAAGTHIGAWLRHGSEALTWMHEGTDHLHTEQTAHNHLSQLNVLLQLEHLRSYPLVRERIEEGELRLHAWWFDIGNAEVASYDEETRRFVVIDEDSGPRLLRTL